MYVVFGLISFLFLKHL